MPDITTIIDTIADLLHEAGLLQEDIPSTLASAVCHYRSEISSDLADEDGADVALITSAEEAFRAALIKAISEIKFGL